MGVALRLKAAARALGVRRPTTMLRSIAHRLVEMRYERHFGIRTAGDIPMATLGVHDQDAVHYAPSPYLGFFRAMALVRAEPVSSVFVDYGSGLGRVVICAATLPFRRVIGVEFVAELNRRARLNIEAARPKFACADVQVLDANAASWRLPDEANVLHFYNPFLNDTLRATLRELTRSLRESPREVWIVFGWPALMSRLLAAAEIIPLSWQKWSGDVGWPFHKDISATDATSFRYWVYRIDPR